MNSPDTALPTTEYITTLVSRLRNTDLIDDFARLDAADLIERLLRGLAATPPNIKADWTMNEEIKPEAKRPPWECAARKQGTAGGNDAADCDWPCCGCDTYANKVMAALDEAGFELIKKRPEPAATPARDAMALTSSVIQKAIADFYPAWEPRPDMAHFIACRVLATAASAVTDEDQEYAETMQDVARQLRMVTALEFYAKQYCEGWCREASGNANFDDCGGCKARIALVGSRPEPAATAVTRTEICMNEKCPRGQGVPVEIVHPPHSRPLLCPTENKGK